jgi:hypothetical protein
VFHLAAEQGEEDEVVIVSAATLADVVVHYNRVRGLGLTEEQQRDLVEYLKSL